MPTEIYLDAGVAKFTVDLSEFVSAAKDLANAAIGANEKEQARAVIKNTGSAARGGEISRKCRHS